MLNIPAELIAEKNKLFSSGAFLELLEIQITELSEILRIVNNNEDIIYNGYVWQKFKFEPGDFKESQESETPNIEIKVTNVLRVTQNKVEETENGLLGDTVIYRMVHADHLDKDPAITMYFSIMKIEFDLIWVYFHLGAENFFMRRFPLHVYSRNICRYEVFKGPQCLYSGAASECNRTFARCIEIGNQLRFGNCPGIPRGAFTNLPESNILYGMDGEVQTGMDGEILTGMG